MKKNILFASLLALAAPTVLTSCSDDETEGLSRFTYYAILEMNGAANYATPVDFGYNIDAWIRWRRETDELGRFYPRRDR